MLILWQFIHRFTAILRLQSWSLKRLQRYPGGISDLSGTVTGLVIDPKFPRNALVDMSLRESLPDVITSGISRKRQHEIYDNQSLWYRRLTAGRGSLCMGSSIGNCSQLRWEINYRRTQGNNRQLEKSLKQDSCDHGTIKKDVFINVKELRYTRFKRVR